MVTLKILPLLFIKVLIIDTGLSDKNIELLKYVDSYEESTVFPEHGSAVTSIILSDQRDDWVCDNVRVTVCNFMKGDVEYRACLSKAATGTYDYVNMSLSGYGVDDEEERLLELTTHNSIVITAAGNNARPISETRPAGYIYKGWGNILAITNLSSPASNSGIGGVDVVGNNILTVDHNNNPIRLGGTSISVARYTHELIQRRCRHDFNNDDNYNGSTGGYRPKPSNVRRKGRKQL
jgi:hypothetical protein